MYCIAKLLIQPIYRYTIPSPTLIAGFTVLTLSTTTDNDYHDYGVRFGAYCSLNIKPYWYGGISNHV